MRKRVFYQLDSEHKIAYISEQIKKDKKLSLIFLGTIIGHFSLTEWNDYLFDEKDLNKRITSMIIQRLQDQVEEI